jgi:hypothetical protein
MKISYQNLDIKRIEKKILLVYSIEAESSHKLRLMNV